MVDTDIHQNQFPFFAKTGAVLSDIIQIATKDMKA
jgi:hypothetical protein